MGKVPEGHIQITISENVAADMARSLTKDVNEATGKIEMYTRRLDEWLQHLQTATEALRQVDPQNDLFNE